MFCFACAEVIQNLIQQQEELDKNWTEIKAQLHSRNSVRVCVCVRGAIDFWLTKWEDMVTKKSTLLPLRVHVGVSFICFVQGSFDSHTKSNTSATTATTAPTATFSQATKPDNSTSSFLHQSHSSPYPVHPPTSVLLPHSTSSFPPSSTTSPSHFNLNYDLGRARKSDDILSKVNENAYRGRNGGERGMGGESMITPLNRNERRAVETAARMNTSSGTTT